MRINPELMREIMLFAEGIPAGNHQDLPVLEGHEKIEANCHAHLLHASGFLDGTIIEDQNGTPVCCRISDLSWKGHQFLRLSKNKGAWEIAKGHFKKKAVIATIDMFFEFLETYARNKLTVK